MTEKEIFINKAQNKIANLATAYVDAYGRTDGDLNLLLQLVDFVENLQTTSMAIASDAEQRRMHYYNRVADLNSIPYLVLTNYQSFIITGEDATRTTIYVRDIIDFTDGVNKVIANFEHNKLKAIQGGTATDRWHVTKAMHDWVNDQMNVFVAPAADLGLVITPTSTTGYYEKGTSITQVRLVPAVTLNSGKSVVQVRFYKNNIIMGSPQTTLAYKDDAGVTVNSTYRLEVDFEAGGTKTDTEQVTFVPPIWYGVAGKGASLATVRTLQKVIEPVGLSRSFVYTIPEGNVSSPSPLTAFALVPGSMATKMLVSDNPLFDTYKDWIKTPVTVALASGNEAYHLYEFKNTTQGTFNFVFKWQ